LAQSIIMGASQIVPHFFAKVKVGCLNLWSRS